MQTNIIFSIILFTRKSRYLGEDDTLKTLIELIAYHNSNMITVLKFGTMKNYYATGKYLNRFSKD